MGAVNKNGLNQIIAKWKEMLFHGWGNILSKGIPNYRKQFKAEAIEQFDCYKNE